MLLSGRFEWSMPSNMSLRKALEMPGTALWKRQENVNMDVDCLCLRSDLYCEVLERVYG